MCIYMQYVCMHTFKGCSNWAPNIPCLPKPSAHMGMDRPSAYSAGSRASGPHSADDSAQLLDAAPGQVGYVYIYMFTKLGCIIQVNQ